MRVLLVDDEPLALERLTHAFAGDPLVEVVGTATDGIEASDRIAALKPDLVILDVQMPGRTGIEVARRLPPGGPPEFAFVTAYEEFAAEALTLDAVDYLIKPVRFDRLRQTVERARRRRAARDKPAPSGLVRPVDPDAPALGVAGPAGRLRVPVADIVWLEAGKDYVLVHTMLHTYVMTEPLTTIEAVLDPAIMLRVNRSALVNRAAVRRVTRALRDQLAVTLSDGVELAVGSNYARTVAGRLEGIVGID